MTSLPPSPAPVTFDVKRADILRYAGAAGDYHPLHTDDAFARAAGAPSLFAHGMFGAGLLATAVNRWVGVGELRRYRVRFVGKIWPDEPLSASIEVTGLEGAGRALQVTFSCSLISSTSGEVKVAGTGVAHWRGRQQGEGTSS